MGVLGRAIAFLILSGIIVLLFQVVSLKAGYEIDMLQKRLETLAKERQELLLKVGKLTSFERVREYIEKNGFAFIESGKVVYLNINKGPLMKAKASGLGDE